MFYTITKSLQNDLKINQTKYFNTVGSVWTGLYDKQIWYCEAGVFMYAKTSSRK
jgi:hypothetical protein